MSNLLASRDCLACCHQPRFPSTPFLIGKEELEQNRAQEPPLLAEQLWIVDGFSSGENPLSLTVSLNQPTLVSSSQPRSIEQNKLEDAKLGASQRWTWEEMGEKGRRI